MKISQSSRFRAMLFRMLPKQKNVSGFRGMSFRAMLFRMLPKPRI